jgi:hypothetical protein
MRACGCEGYQNGVCGGRPLLTEVVIVYQKDRLTSTGDDIQLASG